MRKPSGRTSKLNPELTGVFLGVIRAGNTLDVACRSIGVDKSTVHRWIEKGKVQERGQYREFYLAYHKARVEMEKIAVLAIRNRAANSEKEDAWKAAAWYLEHRYPDRWGRRYAKDQAAPDPTPGSKDAVPEDELDYATDEEVAVLMDIRRKVAARRKATATGELPDGGPIEG